MPQDIKRPHISVFSYGLKLESKAYQCEMLFVNT